MATLKKCIETLQEVQASKTVLGRRRKEARDIHRVSDVMGRLSFTKVAVGNQQLFQNTL